MKYQTTLSDNKVQCTVCPRNCKLADRQAGFCSVRENIDGNIVSTTYGYNTGLAIDPIEKKPLYHFLPGTKVLSFGTYGCNMGCQFCQNWHITKETKLKNLIKATPKEIAETALSYGCESVAFTYNDPVVFLEYAIDTAKECHKRGLKTVAVTAGYINPEPRAALFEHIDAVNIDLKAFSDKFYKKNCLAHLEPILETIKYVKDVSWLELTTLLIEGENDSDDEIRIECEWIVENLGVNVPLHLSAFFPAWKMINKKATSLPTLLRAYNIAKETGINYVYTGNVLNDKTSSTYCTCCKNPVIIRNGYEISAINLTTDGLCTFCGKQLEGIFL